MGNSKRQLLLAATLLTPAILVPTGIAHAQIVTPPVTGAPSTQSPAPTPTPTPTPNTSNPIRPFQGDIRTFWGDIRTFNGDIRTFWGDIRTFWGDIRTFGSNTNNPWDATSNVTFWGDLSVYNTPTNANAPAWSAVGDFWTNNGAAMNTIGDSWNAIGAYNTTTASSYATLAQQIKSLFDNSATTWGGAVTAKTGKSFNDGLVAPLLAKYNVDLNNPQTLANTDPATFLLAYYDTLMNYSGRGHVDHWMKEIDYTPSMTQQIGDGARATIGVLDQTVSNDQTNRLTSFSPSSTFTTGHGDAVASLLIADPTKGGVMGMAPMATVVTYNPFDATGTAGWGDIQAGVVALSNAGAGVVNASLGVPGWTLNEGWNQVFSNPQVSTATANSIFVIAAGNDGVAQSQNILWNFKTNPTFVVVGSSSPNGQISSFSNTPGNACLSATDTSKKCPNGSQLMDYFITAPGENILVSDGQGGVTRYSGTSFAAPFVSGTIALLQDRWPWLQNYPKETVNIVLKTARPISNGTPGTPAVGPNDAFPLGLNAGANSTYGVGELDVGAALSPIDFSKIKYYQYLNGQIVATSATQIRDPKQQAKWNAAGMYFYAYETIGKTFRDFAIPMDSSLLNQSLMSAFTGSMQQFQYYVLSRMQTWMGTTSTASNLASLNFSAPAYTSLGLNMSVAFAPKEHLVGFRQSEVPYQTAVRLSDPANRFAFTIGAGDGALVMSDRQGFGSPADYDPNLGGANPVLGYASGGAYSQATVMLTSRLAVSTGLSQRDLQRDLRGVTPLEQAEWMGIRPYHSQATSVSLGYTLSSALKVTGTYTHLHENDAILGQQSINPYDIAQGSSTDGATVDVVAQLTPTLSLDATGTVTRTLALGDQNYRTSAGGLRGTSWQFGVSKQHLVDGHDALRVTLAQPLHLEEGGFDYSYVKVIDRQTGELGVVTQHIGLGDTVQRNLVSEAVYAHDLIGGKAQVRLFGRANVVGQQTVALPAVTAGAGFRLRF